ncbi:cation:dicarboxylase symporter family transporter [Clostridium psychrophilum]|nr:cation:dicarboxylase symporter family transporter [Clostridium psychrophilum]
MIVVPIVFSSLVVGVVGVVGVAGVGDGKEVGKIGLKTIIYFEIITTIAIFLGLFIGNVIHPGTGIDMHSLVKTSISSYAGTAATVQTHSFIDTFVNIVPTNIMQSLASGDMLSIIFFSLMFGLGIGSIGEMWLAIPLLV